MQINTMVSSGAGLFSNTHLLGGPDGLVVVDPPMLLPDARVVAAAVAHGGRRLAGIIYTHPHPDHVNGATTILDAAGAAGRVPVYATVDTARVSREIDGPKREFWTPVFGADYPAVTTFPTDLVDDGGSVTVGGIPFTVHDLGAGECATAGLWIASGQDGEPLVLAGDLLYNGVHPWLFEGRSSAWLAQLDRAAGLIPPDATLLLGHGAAVTAAALATQATYIRAFRAAVTEIGNGLTSLPDEAKAALSVRMQQQLPGGLLPELVAMSADPIAAELAAEHAMA